MPITLKIVIKILYICQMISNSDNLDIEEIAKIKAIKDMKKKE